MSGLVLLLEQYFTSCFRKHTPIKLFKLHEIWQVDSQENHQNCCRQMSYYKAKMHQIRFPLGLCPDPLRELTAFPMSSSWI